MWDELQRISGVASCTDTAVRLRAWTCGHMPAWVDVWFPGEGVAATRISAYGVDGALIDWARQLVAVGECPQSLSVRETSAAVEVTGPGVTVKLEREPLRIVWTTLGARAVETLTDLGTVHELPIVPAPGLGTGEDGRAEGVRVALGLEVGERIVGMGERFASPDLRGRRVPIWNEDADGVRTMAAYKAVPFAMTDQGWGIWVNSPGFSQWDLGQAATPAALLATEGGILEWYMIAGPTPKEILRRYTALTGRSPLLPAWAHGVWFSTSAQPSGADEILDNVARLRQVGIPADVVHLDATWQEPGTWSSLKWNRRLIPDPPGLMQRLRQLGYHVSVWEQPYVEVGSPAYEDARERGLLLRRSDGSGEPWCGIRWGVRDPVGQVGIIDFTHPDVGAWYRDQHAALLEGGVDVLKTDFAEEIPRDAVTATGVAGGSVHNIYALCYVKTAYETIQHHHRGTMVWARSAHAGSQRYPAVWSGDPHASLADMRLTLWGGLNAAASGLAHWASDIGGYKGTPDVVTFIRWAQFGLLSPLARFHGETPRWPWRFGEAAVKVVRDTARLRYRLIPYLRALAVEAHETGVPVMRPMWMQFPGDPQAWQAVDQYMLGDAFLVAPVLSANGRVRFYLPAGEWLDWFGGSFARGPVWVEREEALETFPLWLRAASAVPMFAGAPTGGGELEDRLDVVFAGDIAPSVRTLAVDGAAEGTVVGTVRVHRQDGTWEARLDGSFPPDRSLVVIECPEHPVTVEVEASRRSEVTRGDVAGLPGADHVVVAFQGECCGGRIGTGGPARGDRSPG